MSSKIKVDLDQLTIISKLFLDGRELCRLQDDRIKTVTEELLESWTGESKKAFENKYNQIKNQMYSYEEMFDEISKELKFIAANFEKADEEIERRMKAQ